MSANAGSPDARFQLDPVLLPRAILWSVIAGVLTYTVVDPDLWGHVRFGLDIISAGSIPSADHYSFTSDRAWLNHEWLSEAAMGAAYRFFGPLGLALLKTCVILAAVLLIRAELTARRVPPIMGDALVLLVVICSIATAKSVRPQVFSFFLFAALLVTCRRVESGQAKLLPILPLLLGLWANLHGGWLAGLGVLGVWTAVRCVWPLGTGRVMWATTGIAALAATLANPYGVALWRFLQETVSFGRANIVEWQPITALPAFEAMPWVMAATLGVAAIVRFPRMPLTHIIAFLVMAFSAFRVVRLAPFFALTVVVLLSPFLFKPETKRAAAPATGGALAFVAVLLAVTASASGWIAFRNLGCIRMTGDWLVDQRAAALIRQASLSGRMFTWFDWGEYAIWFLSPQIRVSIDGRRETVYSNDVLQQHDAIYRGHPGWQEHLARLNPDFIWLPLKIPTIPEIEAQGWHRLIVTDRSVVLARRALDNQPSGVHALPQCFPGG